MAAQALARDLRTRLGAAKLLLNQAPAGALAAASQIQADAFCSVAAAGSLSASDAADLSQFAAEVGFAEDDLAAVLQSLAPKDKEKQERKP